MRGAVESPSTGRLELLVKDLKKSKKESTWRIIFLGASIAFERISWSSKPFHNSHVKLNDVCTDVKSEGGRRNGLDDFLYLAHYPARG